MQWKNFSIIQGATNLGLKIQFLSILIEHRTNVRSILHNQFQVQSIQYIPLNIKIKLFSFQ